ncbi:hypothetical protein SDC9_212781 [bioreactor metagenome]|uniref:Uncharacterized protein n=1 Tax=bioreactor metagenome TaxID=1076179 RepID=A0A645JNX7_9ZZZZ
MFGEDGGIHVAQEGGVCFFQLKDDCVVIYHFEPFNAVSFARLVGSGTLEPHNAVFCAACVAGGGKGCEGENDIFGGEGLTVMPDHVIAQVEGVGQAVFRDFPILCQIAHEIEFRIRHDQVAENHELHIGVGCARLKHGVQVGNFR